jgi:ribosomal protein S3AE
MARVKKTEKKTWFPVIAPKIFHNQVVGEMLLSNPSAAVGRTVPVNLANLARDPRRQNITIKLEITNAAGEKLHTDIIGYEINPSFVKRMVRKGGDKLDHSFAAETADSKKLRLKIVFLTRRKINLSVATALRKKTEEMLRGDVKKTGFEEVMQSVVAHKMQGNMKKQLNKIYPLKIFEIRKVEIEKYEEPSKKAAAKKEGTKEKPARKAEEKKEAKPEPGKEETPKEETKTEEKKE